MNYFLAVDGGGTKTHVLCADETGKVVSEGISGPTSLTATTVGAAVFNLREAIRQAVEQSPEKTKFTALVMGLAGLDTKEEEKTAYQVFGDGLAHFQLGRFTLINDILIALESGTASPNALALISGTGSNCFGRNAQGQTAKAGGMDYLLTDQGSGYAIGRAVLRAAVKSYDGRGPKTELEQLVCEHFRIESIADLKPKVYTPPLMKTEVAEITQLCLRAYDQGDAMAKSIFDQAINDLEVMAKTVLHRLDLVNTPTDCVLAGSVTKLGYIQSQLQTQLKEYNPQLQLVVPTQAPVYGALKMALQPVLK